MESIFFEKQEGSLCAQHALNALLQGSYFTAVELADIARRLDQQERDVYAEQGGVDSPEYLRAMQEESHNMDDSGYFSVQVISEALKVWNLVPVPYMSDTAGEIRNNPTSQTAYICNYREHWFTIRKLGFQWFNLNSMLNGPELISDTYLHMFLHQLQNEGYSIFIIEGALPGCRAEEILRMTPVDPALAATSSSAANQRKEFAAFGGTGNRLGGPQASSDPDLAAALALSRQEAENFDEDLQRALELSKQDIDSSDPTLSTLLATTAPTDEDADLREAIRLSMEADFGGIKKFKKMWFEAKKQERKIRSIMVDHKRRAERRQDFYDKIKREPAEFMQLHGVKCKIQVDPNVSKDTENSALRPCRGDGDNLMDRFDARAHLDIIPEYRRPPGNDPDSDSDEETEETRRSNYERYPSEERFLKQIYMEERHGVSTQHQSKLAKEEADKKKKLAQQKAAIAFTYDDGSERVRGAQKKEEEEEESSSEEESDPEFDVTLNVDELTPEEMRNLDKIGAKFKIRTGDFVKYMGEDKQEQASLDEIKREEEAKAAMAGKKSRRERQLLKQERLLLISGTRDFTTSLSYAKKESPERVERSSSSRSPSVEKKIEWITSFGGEKDSDEGDTAPLQGPAPPPPEYMKLIALRRKKSESPDFGPKTKKREGSERERSKSRSSRRHHSRERGSGRGRKSRTRSPDRRRRRRTSSRERRYSRSSRRTRTKSRSRSRDRRRRRSRTRSRDRRKERRRRRSTTSSSSGSRSPKRRRTRTTDSLDSKAGAKASPAKKPEKENGQKEENKQLKNNADTTAVLVEPTVSVEIKNSDAAQANQQEEKPKSAWISVPFVKDAAVPPAVSLKEEIISVGRTAVGGVGEGEGSVVSEDLESGEQKPKEIDIVNANLDDKPTAEEDGGGRERRRSGSGSSSDRSSRDPTPLEDSGRDESSSSEDESMLSLRSSLSESEAERRQVENTRRRVKRTKRIARRKSCRGSKRRGDENGKSGSKDPSEPGEDKGKLSVAEKLKIQTQRALRKTVARDKEEELERRRENIRTQIEREEEMRELGSLMRKKEREKRAQAMEEYERLERQHREERRRHKRQKHRRSRSSSHSSGSRRRKKSKRSRSRSGSHSHRRSKRSRSGEKSPEKKEVKQKLVDY